MMASDMNWTAELGNAFLSQPQDVMDAVQRMRRQAEDYGYLQSNAQVTVSGGPDIEIMPVNPAFICVPVYDPLDRIRSATFRIFRGRRDSLWIWHITGLRIRPLGMGQHPLRLGPP